MHDYYVNEKQVGGEHYRKHKYQPWEVMQDWFTPEEFKGFLKGNCLKYLCRENDKGGLEDLQKAMHYLEKLVSFEEERRCP